MKAMYRAALMVAALVFLLPLSARSEIREGSFEVGPFGGYNFFESSQNLKNRPFFGGRLGYNFTSHFGIEAAGEFISSSVDDMSITGSKEGQYRSPMDKVDLTLYHIDAVYHIIPDGKFNPFVLVGFGGAHYSPKISNRDMAAFNVGVGAKYWLTDNIALRGDVRDNMIFDEHIHNVETTLGVVFAFGGKSAAAPAPVEPPPAPAPVPLAVEPPPAPPAAPTAALLIDPATITRGESVIITWKSENATGCEIQPAIGSVPSQGVRTVTPASSTSYKLTCSGPGGRATSLADVTVMLPPPPAPAPLPPKAAAAAKRFCNNPAVLEINFDTDKWDIKPRYHDELKTVGDFLVYFPNAKGEISGHTDSTASNAHNQKLSERRANSVGNYIITTFGVDSGRVTTQGYGETKPIASNKTKAGRAKNRRIVANFTCE